MDSFSGIFADHSGLNQVSVPDLWQQQAVAALRDGKDVVVHAPTGSGKTLVFELWSHQGRPKGQAIYTVPTRALANDKLAEWRGRGWNVGIATGDLAENLDAPIIVATLETQKRRLIRGEGPQLLVVDEYQMLGDPDRGLNYELAIALAPAHTQLLLLSGSVANPHDLVKWLTRLGRSAVLIRHEERAVPLEEVHANSLNHHVPTEIKGYWPRLIARVLAEGLGPLLVFAPRRQAAEELAAELSRFLPTPNPLSLTVEQKQLVGDHLYKLLKNRVAYHHSGLSYGARAGVIEPLAKAGQLRVVVATMGLAAGINFSLRSVALAGESYRRDQVEQPLRPDELIQMFGRAGRRGIDEVGYVIVTANEIRMHEAHPGHLSRTAQVDWSALLGLMREAALQGKEPFAEAVRAQERLFTTKPIWLGVEESLKNPNPPCGLSTDTERARHVRRRVREFLNPQGEWEAWKPLVDRPAGEVISPQPAEAVEPANGSSVPPAWVTVLSVPEALEKIGFGGLTVIEEREGRKIWGRSLTVADVTHDQKVVLTKWTRRITAWGRRETTLALWETEVLPILKRNLAAKKLPIVRTERHEFNITAFVSLEEQPLKALIDRHGQALWQPPIRDVTPTDCGKCSLAPTCQTISAAPGVAAMWRRLGLVSANGRPTRRGEIVSCFAHGDGLAVAAGLEDETYPISEMVYDLADLDAGFRFCGEENRWAGRLALCCHQVFGFQSIPGYLENGLPLKYGSGAETIVASVHRDPASKSKWVRPFLGMGDIDRMIIEWRSLLRQITHSPAIEWDRWSSLQTLAKEILAETESPTLIDLPPLEYTQTKRVDHRLALRRH
ncbi:MAG: DEAD/DEAH box helicase [Verrucomicrobiales bacterium]|nr:DEAD/DEAH box helicase [Verrucomicrobiales bacterium]